MNNTITKKTVNNIIDWIQKWFNEKSGNAKGIIIGISGGKDSTVCAKLCCEAIGKDKVYGVIMPNGIQSDIEDAIEVCEILGIRYRIINIKSIYDSIYNNIRYSTEYKNNEENKNDIFPLSIQTTTNISPRIRMIILYTIGQELGYRICGTGNASEIFVGYCTKHGDTASDFNPIANYYMEEVMQIGDILKLPGYLVHKIPSDGLCGKSDEDNLGFSYDEIKYVADTLEILEIVKFSQKEKEVYFERYETLDNICKRHFTNLHKFEKTPSYNENECEKQE